ncbi:MAG TPA: hypothetical protein VJ044_07670, partial [Candidatus Hodarchaeales archaeon]|nr:hypothetical protein [Candidatus Hodarchaeales archaeon]
MNDLIKKLSEAINKTTASIRDRYKNTHEDDDKLLLSDILNSLMEAKGLIVDIQEGYQSIVNEKKAIEEQAKQAKDWEQEKMQYEPFTFHPGATVMTPKEGEQSPYLTEWLCKNCFDDKKKSQLQPLPKQSWVYGCPRGKTPYPLNQKDLEANNEARNVP